MVRHPTELLRVLVRHYTLLSAMCRENRRFASDTELEVFCASFEAPGTNLAAVAGRLKEVGAVTQATGDWAPPSYLRAFLAEIEQRHALASPGVVRGWVEKLSGLADLLERSATAQVQDVLEEITDTLASIAGTVGGNCDRIGAEVSRYRSEEDARQMRARLGRLITLHADYLEPVLVLIDIGGDFYRVCERVAARCEAIAAASRVTEPPVAQAASTTARDVVWLRRVTLRRALEANRELGPLCEAALRESAVARGVNRALEAIASGRWEMLELAGSLQVVMDQDGPLLSDRAAAAFAAVARRHRQEPPPLLEEATPTLMEVPWTTATLLDELITAETVPDLLEWVCARVGVGTADLPAGLAHSLLDAVPEAFTPSGGTRTYVFDALDVETQVWTWRAFGRE